MDHRVVHEHIDTRDGSFLGVSQVPNMNFAQRVPVQSRGYCHQIFVDRPPDDFLSNHLSHLEHILHTQLIKYRNAREDEDQSHTEPQDPLATMMNCLKSTAAKSFKCRWESI
jgi:hypothetical protein